MDVLKKKKIWIGISFVFLIVVIAIVWYVTAKNQPQPEPQRIHISDTSAATIEYVGDQGYKVITSEISSLYSLESLVVEPSEEAFYGDWIYRIIFNPKTVMSGTEEIVVLFGEKNISVNGQTYVAGEGVKYSDILEWAQNKYEYFDYELQQ